MNRVALISIVTAMLWVAGLGGSAYADTTRPAALQGVGIDQRLDQPLPLDLSFRDETGRAVRLGDFFADKPVVLTLAYYHCPMLCPLALESLVRSLRPLSLSAGWAGHDTGILSQVGEHVGPPGADVEPSPARTTSGRQSAGRGAAVPGTLIGSEEERMILAVVELRNDEGSQEFSPLLLLK